LFGGADVMDVNRWQVRFAAAQLPVPLRRVRQRRQGLLLAALFLHTPKIISEKATSETFSTFLPLNASCARIKPPFFLTLELPKLPFSSTASLGRYPWTFDRNVHKRLMLTTEPRSRPFRVDGPNAQAGRVLKRFGKAADGLKRLAEAINWPPGRLASDSLGISFYV
jgi:hypothetical protein